VTADHYAGAARQWALGATIVYGPLARQLVATSPHPLGGRLVLDLGAGTGVASTALVDAGARPVAIDLSPHMLSWNAKKRPPAAQADVCLLPLRARAVDDTIAAFVFNHLVDPVVGIREASRVTRPGGALMACVYANASRSDARDAIDDAARLEGWQVPEWYTDMKQRATPLLGTAADMERAAKQAGLLDVVVDERPADVGVTEPEQLVDYRLGQAHFSAWVAGLDAGRLDAVRRRLVEKIRPQMRPYRPVVVFLSATTPAS
jgi:SAM-dependent methyltransferase